MENYVTLFDGLFLPQGVALHLSMERHLKNYTLWIICVDDITYSILLNNNLPNVRLLQLSKLETPELLHSKSNRSIGEYCWTLTPFSPRFVFEADNSVDRVTYIDADIWFRADPYRIFEEFENSGKHLLITDHAYAPEFDQSVNCGKFCVQFMIFSRKGSEHIRAWWENRCLEWCYARFEDGKFGDQKYLDFFPILFKDDVHILQNIELILAPWNATRFPFGNSAVWHFHGLRIFKSLIGLHVYIGEYYIPSITIINIYYAYFQDIKKSIHLLKKQGYEVRSQLRNPLIVALKAVIKKMISFIDNFLNHFAKFHWLR